MKAVDECLWYRLAEIQYSKGGGVSTLLQGHRMITFLFKIHCDLV